MKIPLIKPYMTPAIKARVMSVLDSGYLTEGAVTKEFEKTFAAYIGIKHALAVTSCTTGLEMAFRALGIGVGDEVIVPDYTYPATAGAVSIVGATPVIVDVNPDTQLISKKSVEAAINSKTRAICPVSIFGNPLDYSWLNELKAKHNLYIIEDAACSIGAQWQGQKVGVFADISVFSLHPRKFITTGEGGIIVTNNDNYAQWMQSYKHFGMLNTSEAREGVHFVRMGTNYKLSNVVAAIGLGQMQDIDMLLAERNNLAKQYKELLQGIPEIKLPTITSDGKHAWQTFCIIINNRDEILQSLRLQGIEVQIGTYSLHMHKAFQGNNCRIEGNMKNSKVCFEKTLALPMYHGMTKEEQCMVVNSLKKILKSK